ncbi:MAG: hypothetical protein QM772_17375 [Ottowia sp.]
MDLLRIFGLFALTDLAGIMGGCLLWLWAVDGVRPAPPTGRRLPCV